MNRVQDADDVLAVVIEQLDVRVGRGSGDERPGYVDVPLAKRVDRRVHRLLPFGLRDEREKRVGDAPARRQYDSETGATIGFDDVRDALHARRVGDAGAAKLMNSPFVHASQSYLRGSKVRRAVAGSAREAIDDVHELREAFGMFVGAECDAVRHAFLDVELQD